MVVGDDSGGGFGSWISQTSLEWTPFVLSQSFSAQDQLARARVLNPTSATDKQPCMAEQITYSDRHCRSLTTKRLNLPARPRVGFCLANPTIEPLLSSGQSTTYFGTCAGGCSPVRLKACGSLGRRIEMHLWLQLPYWNKTKTLS